MDDPQNRGDRLLDQMEQGLLTAAQANVQMLRDERFRIVHRLPRDVRRALNDAVKAGELGHMKADGAKPEVYYHPTFKSLAHEARNAAAAAAIRALTNICATGGNDG